MSWPVTEPKKKRRRHRRSRESYMRERFLGLIVLLASAMIGWSAQAAKVDVTGEWTFSVESAAGSSTPMVTFKQEGEKLTGHYSSQLLGEAPLTGTVKGQTI